MNANKPHRKRRYQCAMPTDRQGHTYTLAGDGGHQEFSDFDKDVIPEPIPPKQSRVSCSTLQEKQAEPIGTQGNLEHCHRFSVLVSDSDYFRKSLSDSEMSLDQSGNSKISAKPERMELRFYCKLKDLWTDKYTRIGPKRRRRLRKIVTGDPATDNVLTNLELQGYGMLELLSKSRTSSILVSYSQIQKRNVVLKFSKITERSRVCVDDCMSLPEVQLYTRLKHENIIRMHDFYIINAHVILSLEFCENGNLKQLVECLPGKFLTEPIAHRYFAQMLSAVEFLHTSYIVHRDISSDHFLIDQFNHVKLCDLSHAKEYKPGAGLLSDRIGTSGYLAPEVLEAQPEYNPIFVDIWALGVVLFEITTGRLPFTPVKAAKFYTDSERDEFLCEMSANHYLLLVNNAVRLSYDIVDLFKGIFRRNVRDRYTLNRVIFCDWCHRKQSEKLRIGNFFMIQQPQKKNDSRREMALKKAYEI